MKKSKKNKSIHLDLYDSDVYADYGIDDDELLNAKLIDTVETLANSKPISTKISLHFVTKNDAEINQKRFKKAYKNSVDQKIDKKNHEIARCTITGSIFLVIAIVIATIYVYFSPKIGQLGNIFFYIFQWVFIASTIQVLTIDLTQLLIDRAKLKRLLNARLYFNIDEDEK